MALEKATEDASERLIKAFQNTEYTVSDHQSFDLEWEVARMQEFL
jgi:hypothetical protein